MTTVAPFLHLGVAVDGAGRHPAAWRHPGARPDALFTAAYYVELTQRAEADGLDLVAFDDAMAVQSDRVDRVRGRLDALSIAARVAPVSEHVGLLPTVTTTHTEPFHTAKNVATLDWVSRGRAGWRVAVTETEAEAALFGRKHAAPLDELWAEASDYVDVVRRLCDSWEDDAIIRDAPTGRYIDRDKVHYIDFEGRFFSVRGPSITPRSPQAQPLVAIDYSSPAALVTAARHADVVFVAAADIDGARTKAADVRAAVVAAGRPAEQVTVMAVADVLLADTAAAAIAEKQRLDEWAGERYLTDALEFVGRPDDLVELFASWAGAVDGFLVRPLVLPLGLVQFGERVMPELQRLGLARTADTDSTLRERFGLARPDNRYAGSTP
jgi:alkanesulfonate monooxygenase SsuD/methylene tetrahydromethanopterin reductase-like flavin-dependent oxidoreductase (luciferase family)